MNSSDYETLDSSEFLNDYVGNLRRREGRKSYFEPEKVSGDEQLSSSFDPESGFMFESKPGYVPPPPERPKKPYAPGGRWSGGLDYVKAGQKYQKDFDEWNEKYGENPDGPINRTGYIPLHKLSDSWGI